MSRNSVRAAFFDVDGTLTSPSSMLRFLAFYCEAMGRSRREFQEQTSELRAMAAIGCGREAIHRAYFANLQGLDVGTVSAVAQSWFAAETASGAYYHAPTVDRLRRHQQRGDHIAILSGSFPALVLPMARDLGVEDVQCTQPEMIHGRYTGGFEGAPLIGPAKGAAARRAALRAGLDPGNCAAYADHLSDLPMLEAVGKAYVVGGGTALRALARARGWRLLDGPPEQPTPHQQAGMAMAPRLAV